MKAIGWRLKRSYRAGALALGVLMMLAACGSIEAAAPQPDALALARLLKDGQFATLEATIVDYQKRFEADHQTEWVTVAASDAFANSDPELEPRLNEWVAAMPDSYAAPLARGAFYDHLAWLSRGSGYAGRTDQRRFAEMERFFALAQPDLKRALDRNPNLIAAYETLAEIAKATGDGEDAKRILNAGLAIAPESGTLHAEFLGGLQPKWGGQPGEIRAYLADVAERHPSVAALGWFKSYLDIEAGDQLFEEKKYEEALAQYDRVLQSAPQNPSVMSSRAAVLTSLGRYDEAVAALEQARAGSPAWAGYHFQMAKIHYLQKHGPEALASLDAAIAFDRLNPNYLYLRALTLQALGRFKEAARDLDDAETYGAFDISVQIERSHALSRFSARLDDAIAAGRRATELRPESSLAWINYAAALAVKQDCKAKEALQTFHEVCEKDGQCQLEGTLSAPSIIRYMHCDRT